MKLHIYGYSDCGTRTRPIGVEPWVVADKFDIIVTGNKECPKCSGSGLYYFDKFRTGPCNCCAGKGFCNNDDRRRNYHYWRNYSISLNS